MSPLQSLLVGVSLACLVTASPQQLDFDQINNAPTVASGPTDNGIANQTAALATSFTLTGAATASATLVPRRRDVVKRDVTIGSNVVDTTPNGHFGTVNQLTTVAANTTYWLSGASTHNFYGNLNNYGSIFVSQTTALKQNSYLSGQTSAWAGSDYYNGYLYNGNTGLIQLNDIGSRSAPTYDWNLKALENEGTIQFCGRGDTGGSTVRAYSAADSVNDGLISFEQAFSNTGSAFSWRNTALSTVTGAKNLYNNGAVRLINVNFHNVQNVYGSGCWQLGSGAVLYLEDGTGVYQNPTKSGSLPGQSIILQDSTAVLHMDTAVYSRNSTFGAQLFGFAAGNAIEFYETIKTFVYSASSGYLKVTMSSGNYVNINIGTGYTASNFYTARNPTKYNTAGYNAVFYKGASPSQSIPSTCALSAPLCQDLGTYPPSTSISLSSTVGSSSIKQTTSLTSVSVTSSSTTTAVSVTSPGASPAPASTASASITPLVTSSSIITTISSYSPYYAALATSYTTDPALSATKTTTAGQACVTQPEAGTYCGFINPLDPCAPQPDGYGPVPSPDTASAFLAYSPFHSMASAAPTVVSSSSGVQYQQTFVDLNAGTQGQSYLGQVTLQTYNTAQCAAACDASSLCTAFNLWIERDPSLNPSKNDSTDPTVWGYWCPNPASMTSFKCTLWGSSINSTMATNSGQWREDFQVVITGSNGYDKTNSTTPAIPIVTPATTVLTAVSTASSTFATLASSTLTSSSGGAVIASGTSTSVSAVSTSTAAPSWSSPNNCHGKAINAPAYWISSHFFPGPYNPQVCGDYAIKQTALNRQAAIAASKSSYSACNMFNAYYLHKNGHPHGTYCALYDSSVNETQYATYGGGYSGSDYYGCAQSWTFSLSVRDSGKC